MNGINLIGLKVEIVRCKNARFFLEENIEDIFQDEFDYDLEEYSFKRDFRGIEKLFESCLKRKNI